MQKALSGAWDQVHWLEGVKLQLKPAVQQHAYHNRYQLWSR
jgi:hypothetical protein